MRMNAYLFDLDGTLLNSIELILRSFHHTARIHGRPERSDAYWLAGIGTPLRVQLNKMASSRDELDKMLDTYRSYNLQRHDEMAAAYPGIVDVVKTLYRENAELALVTSKLSYGANKGLRLLGLEDEFSIRICADDVVRGKPDPEPVLKALAALDASPSEAVFIGDSEHDIEAGRSAGVQTAAVSWGPFPREALEAAGPSYWIETPEQILDI